MRLHALYLLPALGLAYPTFEDCTNHTAHAHRPFNTHHNHICEPTPRSVSAPKLHPLQPRDSITIEISSSFTNTSVSNTQNYAKFQVINNAKNAAIAMGDNATHNVSLDSLGDKNMLDSTGIAGGWNTKNHGTNISTEPHKREVEGACSAGCNKMMIGEGMDTSRRWLNAQLCGVCGGKKEEFEVDQDSDAVKVHARDLINVNVLNGKVKGSDLTRSGNGNSVELHIAGNGDNVVNVTIAWEATDSDIEGSISNNTVKIYIGDMKGDLGNNTIVIV